MSINRVVGVTIDGELSWHAANHGPTDHHTLCGIDADDPAIGHTGSIRPPRGQKITCVGCYGIWRGVAALRLRADDFTPEAASC
jgi:hypothetical protein